MARFSVRAFAVSLAVTLAAGGGGLAYYRYTLRLAEPLIPDLTGLEPIKIACVDVTDKVRGREAVAELYELADGRRVARIIILGNPYLYTIYDTTQPQPVRFIDETGDGDFRPLAGGNDPPVPGWVLAGAEDLRGQRIPEHCMVKYGDGGS